jgi:hypothetical protein
MSDTQIAHLQGTIPTGASHELFHPGIRDVINHASPVAGLFSSVGSKGYDIVGKKLVISTQLLYSGGWIGTDGYYGDTEYADPDVMEFTPAQLYLRRSIANFIAARAKGAGAFEDHKTLVENQAWNAIKRGTTRHIHGDANATVCLVDSRTSATVLVVKDGYGHSGTNPLMYIEPNMKMALLDASNSYALLGVAKVSSIVLSTKTITFSTDIDTGALAVAGDVLVFVTTTDSGSRRVNERGRAPMGLRNFLDPDGNGSSYGGITESTRPRIKPVRRSSVDFDEHEIMDFWGELEGASGQAVGPDTHVHTCQRAVYNALARTLTPSTQIVGKGAELEGGWDTIRIAGQDFLLDAQHTHDELMTHAKDHYVVIDLEGEPHVDTSGGPEWQQVDDFDAREKLWKHYVQRIAVQRNCSGTLKGIAVTSGHADRFAAVPTST